MESTLVNESLKETEAKGLREEKEHLAELVISTEEVSVLRELS